MTERELNEALAQIEQLRAAQILPPLRRSTGRRYRRKMKTQKDDRLMRIVTSHYVPRAGYIDWDFSRSTLLHSGKYIKYPKNSNCQRWIKRETGRRIRNCDEVPHKGNYYRRLMDYWWILS